MDTKCEKNIDVLSEKELKQLKKFLFEERIRIKNEQRKLQELNSFFDKKLKILQNGFCQLDLDRKQFEREKKLYMQNRNNKEINCNSTNSFNFFKGVNSQLGLKKRYKDLLKIFHPDNLCGDVETVKRINQQYESMKKIID